MNYETEWRKRMTDTLKSVARRPDIKAYVEQTPWLNRLLRRAAAQYVAGEDRQEGLAVGRMLADMGYAVSLEYIGENTADAVECQTAAEEMKSLIREIGEIAGIRTGARVSFDLSHIGLSVETQLAYRQLMELAQEARGAGIELFISMEESTKTESILDVYRQTSAVYPNIGITLQAQLNRTAMDLAALSGSSRRIRIVKGAYQEPEALAMPRSLALDDRYLTLIQLAIHQGHRVSIATHDERIIGEVINRGWLDSGGVEFEMLYGIRPDLSARLQAEGYPIRIYVTYGHDWYLYLCHRIAEYPPNLYRAIVDMANEGAGHPFLAYEQKGSPLVKSYKASPS